MSYTVEYRDIPSGRGPYWIGPFSSIEDAQRGHSGYELQAANQLYLIRHGRTPGPNSVVSAILNQRWTAVPVEDWPTRAKPHTLLQLRAGPTLPLTSRLVIEVVSAGGSVEGSVSAAGQHQDRLSPTHQQALHPRTLQSPSTSPNERAHPPRRRTRPVFLPAWVFLGAITALLLLRRRR